MPSGPEGMHELRRSIGDVEAALALLRRSAAGSSPAPADLPSSGDVADAERRLAELREANHALQEATARLGATASAALGEQGRRVVRLQRALAEDRVAPSATGRMLESRRRRGSVALAPAFIVAGICATVLASLLADRGVNPFRGQRLAPSPAAAEGGAAAPAIALPPVQAVTVKPRSSTAGSDSSTRRARPASPRRREASSSTRRERAARAARPSR